MPQDFSGQNLRGRSFKGQDLTGANFSHANIRGANFTKANLRGANFSHAQAGLQRRWAVGLVIVSSFLWPLSAFTLAIISNLAAYFFFPQRLNRYTIFGLTLVSCCLIVIFRLALNKHFGAFRDVAVSGALAVAIVAAVAVSGAGAVKAEAGKEPMAVFVFVSLAGLMTLALADQLDELTAAIAGALLGAFPGGYVALQALSGNEKFTWVWEMAVAFAATGGTSFRGADLTHANFTQVRLKSTDLRRAATTQTCWSKVKLLDRARVGGTILIDPIVRNLLVTGQGRNKRYIGRNLKGANLAGADLRDADLTEADISGATLESACLERANLTKIQALGANFNQTILTSACLEAWNIDSTTQLEGAICEYVYLLNNQRERRPSNGEFAPGEFTKLFQEVLSTVDLIFRSGIDWKAFTYSFNKLILDNEGTELSIQSIENKGDGVVVVRVNAPPEANKAKIHHEFNQTYEVALKALEAKYQAQLEAKDEQITIYRQQSADMMLIANQLAARPVNVEVKATAESKSMNESTDQSRKIQIGDVGGDFHASGAALNLGEISGTVTNTINQLPNSPQPNQPGIKELLTELQKSVEAEPELKPEDKAEALEQVKVLAEAGLNPQEGRMKKLAGTAIKILKGTIASLPSAASLVEACNKLLPMITKLLGLG